MRRSLGRLASLSADRDVCPIHPRVTAKIAAAITVLCFMSTTATADDWPFFRGPSYNGISTETGWTTAWPVSGPEVAWRADVGSGASSVVVADHRAFTMGSRGARDQDVVWCFDADKGRALWQFAYPCKFDARQFEGGPASTPTVDGGLVYTLSYDGQLHCQRVEDGRVVWRKHLVDDFGGRYSSWKYAGSPLVVGEQLILDTGAEGDSTVALDKTTGQKIWGAGDDLAGYATPIPFEHAGALGVLVFAVNSRKTLTNRIEELHHVHWSLPKWPQRNNSAVWSCDHHCGA